MQQHMQACISRCPPTYPLSAAKQRKAAVHFSSNKRSTNLSPATSRSRKRISHRMRGRSIYAQNGKHTRSASLIRRRDDQPASGRSNVCLTRDAFNALLEAFRHFTKERMEEAHLSSDERLSHQLEPNGKYCWYSLLVSNVINVGLQTADNFHADMSTKSLPRSSLRLRFPFRCRIRPHQLSAFRRMRLPQQLITALKASVDKHLGWRRRSIHRLMIVTRLRAQNLMQ